jgi:hypothetical protein
MGLKTSFTYSINEQILAKLRRRELAPKLQVLSIALDGALLNSYLDTIEGSKINSGIVICCGIDAESFLLGQERLKSLEKHKIQLVRYNGPEGTR